MTIEIFKDDLTELRVEVTIPNKIPVQVFDYWIYAKHLEKWWVQKVMHIEAIEGGAYEYHWMVNNSTLRGTFTEMNPPEKLSFTWKWDHLPELPQRTVTVELSVVNDTDTRLTIWHRPYDDSAPDQAERQNHIDGWQHFMEMLLKYCVGLEQG